MSAAIALKTQIERKVAQAILGFAGAGATTPDSDLGSQQLVNTVRAGYSLLTQDYKRGPLVAVKLQATVKAEDETGEGDEGRSVLKNGQLIISGISRYSSDPAQTSADRDLLEEVIQLNLQKLSLGQMAATYQSGGKSSYAAILNYLSTEFEEETIPGQESAPKIEPPVAVSGNTSTGSIVVNNASIYTAASAATYTVQVVTANSTPGSLTGLTWRWKKTANGVDGSYSAPQAASTNTFQTLSDGVQVKFGLTAGQNFVANDQWTIQATAEGLDYVAIFTQEWEIKIESQAGH